MLNSNETISVIVPVYNAGKKLNRCINSICSQTYQDLDIILVDDGSTDDSGWLCDKWKEKDNRIQVIHIENSGPSVARNIGLQRRKGRYLAFVDADDWIEPEMYSTLMGIMHSSNTGMVISRWYIHEGKKTIISEIGPEGVATAKEIQHIIAADNIAGGGGFLWNRLIDCTKVDSLQLFNKNLVVYEDKIWLIEMLNEMREVYLSHYIGYHYYVQQGSLSHQNSSERKKNTILAWDELSSIVDIESNIEARRKRSIILFSTFWFLFKNGERIYVKEEWGKHRKMCRIEDLQYSSLIGRCKIKAKLFILNLSLFVNGKPNGVA